MNIFRPTGEKWILTVLLWTGFWLTLLVIEFFTAGIHQWFFPELNQLLPPTLSFDEEITRLFEIHQQELERITRLLLPAKLLISGIASYLCACLVIYLYTDTSTAENVH